MEIRKATFDDIPSLFVLNEEFNGVGSTTEEAMIDSMKSNHNEIVFIAYDNNCAVGFICGQVCQSVCYRTRHGDIAELFVSKKHRRKGIARHLINTLERFFLEMDIHVITLATSVDNVNAQALYEHCGYSGKNKLIYRKNI
jgi:Acetyltransferases